MFKVRLWTGIIDLLWETAESKKKEYTVYVSHARHLI